ncbi:MAG: RNA polymerase sigma factor [Terriglobales bacterium]
MDAQESTFEFTLPAATAQGETELAAQLRTGSVEAFNYLIGIYHQPLYRLVLRMLGDPADSADAVQDIFLKIFRAAARFEGKSSLKTWIYRIAVHEASNYRRWWRRHTRRERPLDAEMPGGGTWADQLADPAASPLAQLMRAEGEQRLGTLVADLADPFRTAVLLRDLEGFGYEEMAEILGVRLGTVKSRLTRGRELLRRRLLADPELCRELGVAVPAPVSALNAPPAPPVAACVARVRRPQETHP